MKKAELREKILDVAMDDFEFADQHLSYVDHAVNGMVDDLKRMKKAELQELFEKAKESRYYRKGDE